MLVAQPLLGAVGLVTLTACIAVLRFPFLGVPLFVAIAVCLPFAVFPVRLIVAPTLIDLVLTALLVGWVVRVLHRDEPLLTTHLDQLVILFIGVATVALILGMGYSSISAETLRLFLKLVNSTLLFFGVIQVVRQEEQAATVLRTVLLAGSLAASIAMLLYAIPRETTLGILSSLDVIGYPTTDVLRPVAGTDTLRATGTSVDPNILGAVLMLVGVVLIAQLLAARTVLPRPLLAALAVPIGIALPLTYSRSSWVGLAAGVAFLALGRQRRAAWILALGAAAVLLLPQGRSVVTRLGEAVTASDPASAMRLAEYGNALEIIWRYPAFGIGFGAAPSVDLAVGVSSTYLLIAEQMGLVGLGCFLAIVLAALARSLSLRPPRDSVAHALLCPMEAALAAALVAGLFDHYFFNINFPHTVGLLWLILALLVVASRLSERRGEAKQVAAAARTTTA